MILALDPSSTCTGYALMRGERELIEAGLIMPQRAERAMDRITQACDLVRDLIGEHHPEAVVIEVNTSGHGTGRKLGHGHGLVVYGMAAGAIWAQVRATMGIAPVHAIEANAWTGGVVKSVRLLGIAAEFWQYRGMRDPTGDMGDAIGLAAWWLRMRL